MREACVPRHEQVAVLESQRPPLATPCTARWKSRQISECAAGMECESCCTLTLNAVAHADLMVLMQNSARPPTMDPRSMADATSPCRAGGCPKATAPADTTPPILGELEPIDFAPASRASVPDTECRVPSSSLSTSTSTWATQVLLAIAGQSRPILTPGIVMSQGSACGVDSPSCIHAGVGGDTDERCRYCGNVLRARARLLAGSRTPRAGRIDARQRRCVLCVRALCCECLGFQFSHARLHAQARCVNSIQHPRCMRLPLHPRARRSGEA